uniref:Polysaccharide polymerase n=1 Tax=Vibrio parahaemolyticus TaxID=670 RepID=A0A7M1WNE2_VIBPH|nr:hypothetical protein VP175_00014 [Vibrio parahaemolyticus]
MKRIAFLISLCLSPFVYLLASFYTKGDQQRYSDFYNKVSNSNFLEGYVAMPHILGASEPGYYLSIWSAQLLPDRDVFLIISNFIFVFLWSLFVLRSRYKIYLPLFITNYYFLFLLFGAERNKIALIFIMLMIVFFDQRKNVVFLLMSFLTHLSSFILILIPFLSSKINAIHFRRNIFFVKRNKVIFIPLLLFCLIFILFFLKNMILGKLLSYSNKIFYIESMKVVVITLLVIPFMSSKKNIRLFIIMSLFLCLMALFTGGGGRYLLFTFLIYSFFILKERTINYGYLILLCYFSFKSIGFIERLIIHNDPFFGF